MATDTCSSSLGLGFNPVPIGFHCAFCNVSFKKRKFLKIHCGGLFHRDRLILMKTASCVDESSSSVENDKDDCSSLNKLVTLHHSSDCSKRGTPNSSDSVTTESENDKTLISQEASGNWKNSLCIPEITAGFGNSVQSTPENYRLTSDSLVDKNQKLDDRNHSSLNNVSLSHDDTTFISKLKNAAEVKESFSCKLCRIQTSDRNSLNNHTSSLEHCKLFVLRQNELGMEEFKKQFGDVPFTRILSENIPAPPDDFDPNMTRIYQSAVVNDLLCHACDRQCKTLEEWFQHIYDSSHCQKLNWLHGTHGVFLFLALYGNLPLPESFMPMSVSDVDRRRQEVPVSVAGSCGVKNVTEWQTSTACFICNRRFASLNGLWRHRRVEHGGRRAGVAYRTRIQAQSQLLIVPTQESPKIESANAMPDAQQLPEPDNSGRTVGATTIKPVTYQHGNKELL